ncbi:hypothetical protein B8W69_00410 [Mycobacterium vulneris]|uniref:ATP-dependent Clp protease ATP-binding subunit n=1 Tax=Mycolicibacterium vulneris TaxID=547163 RepID=A0A1X2LFM7_9MYCO|nr:hypothetical protein B8W69_00410 [Mycolicibacterium vulneris]
MFERFNDAARRVVLFAHEEARALNHDHIGTEHILLGLIHEDEGVGAKSLESLGISLEDVRSQVEEIIGEGEEIVDQPEHVVGEGEEIVDGLEEMVGEDEEAPSGRIPFTPRAKKVLELSLREALQLGHSYIGTEHVLLGLIREGEGVAAQVLVKLGAELTRVRQQVIQLLSGYQGNEAAEAGTGGRGDESGSPPNSLVLDQFGRNLTAAAMEGKLHPIIGRQKEIERVMQVLLSLRTKNNPVLIGEPGVGKTAVIEALAQAIVHGQVPETLKGKQLYSLDPRSLEIDSDSKHFEERLKRVFNEVGTRDDIILFIDELHALMGARGAKDAIHAASILEPKLARGELQIIGATTPGEYRNYIEKDAALERRFQPVPVGEPTVRQTIEILKDLRDRYEAHHQVSFTDGACVAAATLADHYINDRFLPSKAIDLIDEAGARMLIWQIRPPGLREFDEKIYEARQEKEAAIDAQDFEKAASMRDREKQLVAERKRYAEEFDFVAEVDDDLIVDVIAEMTDIAADELFTSLPGATHPEVLPEITTDTGHEYRMLNDMPVGSGGDVLCTADLAKKIADIIQVSRYAAPFVMAIDGGWGVGKSSLLEQIGDKLPARHEGVVKLKFNAWTAEGGDALEGLIKSVVLELDPNIVRRWARKIAKRRGVVSLARVSFAIAARFLGLTRLVDDMWAGLHVDAQARNKLREDLHGMLSDWIKQGGKRSNRRTLVVFIDDLDRCTDEVVVRVCEAVKVYLDAPGLIFVIACDLSVIARSAAGRARGAIGEGRTYLEKIVQVSYRVPVPNSKKVNELIKVYGEQSGISQLLDETVVDILAEATERNPRRIKRIINSFVLEHHLDAAWRDAPLNSTLLITAILLQQLYPSLYSVLIDENSGEDPIWDFVDYAIIQAKASNPPSSEDRWWGVVRRTFRKTDLPVPNPASLPVGEGIRIDGLAKSLGVDPDLAANKVLVALLKRIRGSGSRALRRHLRSSPLGTETIAPATDLESGATDDKPLTTPLADTEVHGS